MKFSEFRESHKSLEHELTQFKDPVSDMCLAGAVIKEMSNSNPFSVMTNIFVTIFSEFNESI